MKPKLCTYTNSISKKSEMFTFKKLSFWRISSKRSKVICWSRNLILDINKIYQIWWKFYLFVCLFVCLFFSFLTTNIFLRKRRLKNQNCQFNVIFYTNSNSEMTCQTQSWFPLFLFLTRNIMFAQVLSKNSN